MLKMTLNEMIEMLKVNVSELEGKKVRLMASENVNIEDSIIVTDACVKEIITILTNAEKVLCKAIYFEEECLEIEVSIRKGKFDEYKNIVGSGSVMYFDSKEEDDFMDENDFVEELEQAVEEAAKEAKEEEVEMEEETFTCFQKISEFIVRFNSNKIKPILDAKYEDVPDVLVDSAKEAFNKYIKKNNQKDITKDINAFGKVNAWVNEKKDVINAKADNNVVLRMLVKLGSLLKAIFVKALNMMIATGKIIGKSAIVLGTLIAKATVFAVVEVCKAGKSVLVISKDEYKKAIYR